MACSQWNDDWIAVLYDELAGDAAEAARRHLATCEACRGHLAELEASRTLLRESAPPVPFSPRVVVLETRRRHPAWIFAGGMAAAAALFAVALALGPAWRPAAAADPAFEARIAELERQNRELLDATQSRLTRDDVRDELQDAIQRVNIERAKDFEFLLGEIAATEWRTGNQIRNNSDALLQTMLASNPRFSEQ